MKRTHLLCCLCLFVWFKTSSQCIEIEPPGGNWHDMSGTPCGTSIPTMVPFLRLTPDARSAAMGEAGVALSPTGINMHFNMAALAQAARDNAISLSFSPYPSLLDQTNYFGYFSAFKHMGRRHTIGASIRYFHWDAVPKFGNINDLEFAIGYAISLSEQFSFGITGKYISSNPQRNSTPGGTELKTARSGALDLSLFYYLPLQKSQFNFGLALSNIGFKMGYTEDWKDYLPANFALGAAWEIHFNEYSQLTFTSDVNKLMVPTPQYDPKDHNPQNGIPDYREKPVLSSIITSWVDAPQGDSEFNEFTFSLGSEYVLKKTYTARAGYFWEHPTKGYYQFFTFGLGFNPGKFSLDASYSINISKTLIGRDHLDIFRVSFSVNSI